MPQGDVLLSPLVADQAYEVSVRLVVPHSDMNIALGNDYSFLPCLVPSRPLSNFFVRQAIS